MAKKKKKSRTAEPKPIIISFKPLRKALRERKEQKKAYTLKSDKKQKERWEKAVKEVLKERQKIGTKIEKKIGRKIKGLQKRPLVSKRVVRKAPRATLDLRRHEREPLKQHGFKEVEISNSNFLFN